MADKVRYFLEQSVPELQDLERKKLFTKKEITMIMRRRTDFEHRITGRGSKPLDYLSYVKFEKNLEKLRRKRYIRFKPIMDTKPSISDWASQRRIFFIFERSINKFPKALELWTGYLKYAKKNGSVKVIYDIYSKLLQLQPKNINVWFSAAHYEFEYNKNVKSARNLFKRCLRFNGDELEVWFEFIKFELNYLSKLLARRQLLNLITERQQQEDLHENEQTGEFDDDGDVISLIPDNEINDELNKLPELNVSTLGSIENNPVLKGDLILTIYDICVSQLTAKITDSEERFKKMWDISYGVMKIVDLFNPLDRTYLCNHIVNRLVEEFGDHAKVLVLQLTLSLRYLSVDSDYDELLAGLRNSTKLYQSWIAKSKVNDEVKEDVKKLYVNFLTENYLNKSEGQFKDSLSLLVKKLK